MIIVFVETHAVTSLEQEFLTSLLMFHLIPPRTIDQLLFNCAEKQKVIIILIINYGYYALESACCPDF